MYTENKTKNKAFSQIKELQCSPLTVQQQQRTNTHEKPSSIVEKKCYRFFVSSAGETNAYKFSNLFDERMTDISEIRIMSCMLKYIEPATDALLHETIFIKFKDFPSKNFTVSARTMNNFEYHIALPTNDYTNVGDTVKNFTIFQSDYRIHIGRRANIKELNIEVYYQNDTTGQFHLFTDLTFITIEMELK